MATQLKNLNQFSGEIPDGSEFTFAVIVSQWNDKITGKLLEGAQEALKKANVSEENVSIAFVPGTYELALGAQFYARMDEVDAIICLGCVIQGETRHFDFICQAAADGIMQVGLKHNKPVVFGVLTTDNELQALERAGGKHGNKGFEAGITALQMLALKMKLLD